MSSALDAAIAQQEARKVAKPVAERVAQETAADVAKAVSEPIARDTAVSWLELHPAKDGSDGVDGRDGLDGKAGLDGAPGLDGQAGRDALGINWRGTWRARTGYQDQDAVEFEGSSYIATGPTKGTKPPNGVWNLMAQKGADGRVIRSGNAGGGGSGTGALTILDDGTPVGVATSLDFQGTGVSVGAPSGGVVPVVVSGGGLPPQWTDGGNGDVTATTDANGVSALTLEQFDPVTPVMELRAIAPASTDGETLLRIVDENGDEVVRHEANGRIFVKNAAWTTQVGIYPEGFLLQRADPATYGRPLLNAAEWGGGGVFPYRLYAPGNGYVARYNSMDPGDIGLAFEATTGQTADLAVYRDDNGLDGLRVDKNGRPVIGVTSAPADGDLANSQMALWWDDTDGAPKAMYKGKDVDGTVFSGQLGGLAGSPQTYTESNVTTDRTYNANATSIDELADVLGTLIADLRARGVVA